MPTTGYAIALPTHNWKAVKQLEKELKYFSKLYAGLTDTEIKTGTFPACPGFVEFALSYPPLYRVEKLTRLIKVMRLLLKEFEHLGVQVFPTLEVPEQRNPLDLLVRFPKYAHILISIRSKGESKIVYNEAKEGLYVIKCVHNALITC